MPDGAFVTPGAELGSAGAEPETAPPHAFSRERFVDPSFSLATHLSRTLGIAAGIAGIGVWLAWSAAWWAWLAMPAFWLVANAFEYATHRYPMHKPLRPRVLYQNHACVHHRAFAGSHQQIHHARDLSVVMMPWYTLLLIFAAASPIAMAAALVGGAGLAGVFLLSAVAYFLFYELVHTLHHLPHTVLQGSWWGRSGALARMRAHHHHHHQLQHMSRVNFNVTFAVTDRLLGTYELPKAALEAALDPALDPGQP